MYGFASVGRQRATNQGTWVRWPPAGSEGQWSQLEGWAIGQDSLSVPRKSFAKIGELFIFRRWRVNNITIRTETIRDAQCADFISDIRVADIKAGYPMWPDPRYPAGYPAIFSYNMKFLLEKNTSLHYPLHHILVSILNCTLAFSSSSSFWALFRF